MTTVYGETRTYCDRCKKEIRKDPMEASIEIYTAYYPMEFRGRTRWDLCPECYKTVIACIKGRDGQPKDRWFVHPWRGGKENY